MQLRISGGRLIDPASGIDARKDVFVAQGKVVGIGRAPSGFNARKTIDARGRIVCPGLVDLAARLREPGQEHKATIASETRAASAGGITTLCCPPDTEPVIDTPAIAELIHQRAEAAGYARVVCLGAMTQRLEGELLAEMYALKGIGCVGIGNAMATVQDTEILRRALEYATSCDLTVFLYPEDHWLASKGRMHEGAIGTRLGIPGIPETAETVALSRDLLLIEQTGARAHFGRISTGRGASMLASAQRKGLAVSADTAAHYLYFTDRDVGMFNALYHVRPPLRERRDRSALRRAVKRGSIGVICSDHQPHDSDAKTAPFSVTEPGISALETLLPLTMGLVDAGLPISDAIAALTWHPARTLGLEVGQLHVGAPADICIFDAAQTWELQAQSMLSAGKNSPLLGRPLTGRVTQTVFNGRVVYEQ